MIYLCIEFKLMVFIIRLIFFFIWIKVCMICYFICFGGIYVSVYDVNVYSVIWIELVVNVSVFKKGISWI